MTQPAGDKRTRRTEAVGDEAGSPPVPTTPADAAENAARLAVEGVGITPRDQAVSVDAFGGWLTHWTNWLVGGIEVHAGDRVRLHDGREGVITRVARDSHGQLHHHGWPEIDVGGQLVAVHPGRIASRVE